MNEMRHKANILLLALVAIYVKYHPELRFQQILWSLGISDNTDRFYEEPIDTLSRIKLLDEYPPEMQIEMQYVMSEINKLKNEQKQFIKLQRSKLLQPTSRIVHRLKAYWIYKLVLVVGIISAMDRLCIVPDTRHSSLSPCRLAEL